MRDVTVASFEQFVGPDGDMQDGVTFVFRRMNNSYFVPNPAGGSDIITAGSTSALTTTCTVSATATSTTTV